MSFTTAEFIGFMTIVFVLYYAIPKKYQWGLLLVASYIFYAAAAPIYIVFLFLTTCITYFGAVKMDDVLVAQKQYLSEHDLEKEEKKAYKESCKKKRKTYLVWTIVLLLAMLVVFKYTTFILENVTAIVGLFGKEMSTPVLDIVLPVGLSFYMFQSMGYCIDVYREMCNAERNFFKHATFVSFFPQLLQGPIGDYKKLAPQLFSEHEFDYARSVHGIQRVAWGFFKKLVIANQIALSINSVFAGYEGYQGLIWIIVLVLYSIELYADFSGYMDMALGCAEMLGITLDENFDTPYFSHSITEFWRRWHMTLGTWFKNYVFYSLLRSNWLNNMRKKYKKAGKNYQSQVLPNVCALLIVWLLIGAWHGAAWCYIVYGLFHGFFVIMDTVLSGFWTKWREKHAAFVSSKFFNGFEVVRTFALVTLGYAIFYPMNLHTTGYIYANMFHGLGMSVILKFARNNFYQLLAAGLGTIVLLLVDIYHLNPEREGIRVWFAKKPFLLRWVVYLLFICSIVFLGAYGSENLNQFAYFQF